MWEQDYRHRIKKANQPEIQYYYHKTPSFQGGLCDFYDQSSEVTKIIDEHGRKERDFEA